MAKKLKKHQEVDESFLAGVPTTLVQPLNVPIQVAWNALLDGPAWTEWLPLDSVEWTSEKPYGEGTTRTVRLGNDTIEEYFFGWEEGRRMAFRFDSSTLPLSAGVEDYRLVEKGDGCELQWTFKVSALFPISWLLRKKLTSTLKNGLPKLERMIQNNPERFAQSDATVA